MFLIFISPIIRVGKHIFICLLSICMSTLEGARLFFFCHFWIGLFCILLLSIVRIFLILDINSIWCIVYKCFLPFSRMSFYFSSSLFAFLSFNNLLIIVVSFFCFCFIFLSLTGRHNLLCLWSCILESYSLLEILDRHMLYSFSCLFCYFKCHLQKNQLFGAFSYFYFSSG